jgi:hypothetical protein
MKIGVNTYNIEGIEADDIELITAALQLFRSNTKKRLDDFVDAIEYDDSILEVRNIYMKVNKLFDQFQAIKGNKNESNS